MLMLKEVAALLRVPEATMRYWRHCGTGPRSFTIGRSVRYPYLEREDVLAALEFATESIQRELPITAA
ncbi:MAG: hypothetical protein QM655_11725 [Nocardioidaceae bacterium]